MTFSSRFGRCFLAQTGGAHHKYEFSFLFVWTLNAHVACAYTTSYKEYIYI